MQYFSNQNYILQTGERVSILWILFMCWSGCSEEQRIYVESLIFWELKWAQICHAHTGFYDNKSCRSSYPASVHLASKVLAFMLCVIKCVAKCENWERGTTSLRALHTLPCQNAFKPIRLPLTANITWGVHNKFYCWNEYKWCQNLLLNTISNTR